MNASTPQNRFKALCETLARTRRRNLYIALALGVLLTPGALKTLTHLDTNLFNQAGATLPRFQALREATETFGGETFVAAVWIPDQHSDEDVAALKELGASLCRELASAQNPDTKLFWLNNVACSTQQFAEQARTAAWKYPQLLLRAEDVPLIQAQFEPAALDAALDRLAQTLRDLSPQSPEKIRLYNDPLNFIERFGAVLRERSELSAPPLAERDGLFLSRDGTTLAVLGRPLLPASRLDFSRALLRAAEEAAGRTRSAFVAAHPGKRVPEIGFTGAAAIYVENDRTLKWDVALNLVSSLLAVVLLFAVLYRNFGITWKVIALTAYTIWLTLGVAAFWREHVSVLGVAFTVVPVGLVTDYAILVVNRFQQSYRRRPAGLDIPAGRTASILEAALAEALHSAGPSVLAASAVTALAFFGVGFMHLRGLSEFGILGGLGALIGCATMLLVLPALLGERESQAREWTEAKAPMNRAQRNRVLALGVLFFVAPVLAIAFGARGETETVAGVRFDSELGNLRATGTLAIPLRQRLVERFGIGLAEINVLIDAAGDSDALHARDEVRRRLEPFAARGELKAASAILDLLPSPARQEAMLSAWKALDVEAARRNFEAAVERRFGARGLKYFGDFLAAISALDATLRQAKPVSINDLLQSPHAAWLAQYARASANRVQLRSVWLPSRIDYSREWYERVTAAVESPSLEHARVQVAAGKLTGFELKDATLRDCGLITVLGGAAVALLLLILARSVKRAALMTLPLIFGWVWMLAGVPISTWLHWDYSLNFINLVMIPLLLGSAADYGVFMVFALSERPDAVRAARRTVLFCILTTLIGFGSFVTSSFTGLRSLGFAALWGYAGTSFAALVLLPALLRKKDA